MFSFSLYRRLGAVGLILGPVLAGAQNLLTLAEAQRVAVARSQQVVAQDAAAQSARELAVAAGQLPDPVLKVGVDNLPVNGPDRFSLTRDFMTMRRIGLMQELPRREKRQLRVERVERDIERVAAERAMAIANVQRETALAWVDRHYSQRMLELLRAQRTETVLQEQGAEVAYRSAKGSQADVFAARAALAMLDDKLALTERQWRSAQQMTARWLGPDAIRAAAAKVDWRTAPAADTLVARIAQLPELQQLAAQAAAAETELRQALANTRPDWSIEAMYAQRGPAYSNMVSVAVSIPLQLDRADRQDREVAAKRAAVDEAQARYRDALAAREAEVRVLANDWAANQQRLERLGNALLPAARQRAGAAVVAYHAGKGDLAAVLAARRDEIEARMQVLTLEMETARLWAQLNFLIPDATAVPAAKDQS